MANRVTGSTDTTGGVSVTAKVPRSVIIVAERGLAAGETIDTTSEQIFTISGTSDAASKFGSTSKAVEITRILIANGVSYIKGVLVSEYGADKAYTSKADAFAGALAKTMYDDSIKGILLDTYDSTVLAKVKLHLDSAEAEDMFRLFATGGPVNQTNAQIATANSYNHSRIVYPGPNATDTNADAVDGVYVAAGLMAAIMVSTDDPALPMNGVEIKGFGGVERVLLRADKDALVSAGVTPLYTSADGNPTIYRAVTSYLKDKDGKDDMTWRELTTRMIADDVLESVEARIRTNYKRTKNVARILNSIKTDVIDVLSIKNGLEIIQNFDKTTVSVIKDPNDAYGALVDYKFQVVTPLYTVTINQHMKL